MPEALRRVIRERFRRPVRVEGRFALTAEEERALLAELRPDLDRLHDRYGVDIARDWGL